MLLAFYVLSALFSNVVSGSFFNASALKYDRNFTGRITLTRLVRHCVERKVQRSWDYKRLLWGSRVEFYSSGEAATPFVDEVDYVLDTDAGLRYRINEWARLSLLYELNQVRGISKSASEQEFTIGVGVGW